MDKRTLLYSTGSFLCIIVVLITLSVQNHSDEEAKMLAYLEEKYDQDFILGEVESYDLGFGAGDLIEAQANPVGDDKLHFVITRELGSSTYEDTFERNVVNTTLAEKFLPRVKDMSEDAQFYVQSSYDNELNKRLTKRSLNKIQPSVVVGIPEKTPFNKENYTERILNFLNYMEAEKFEHYTVRIDFTDGDKASALNKYMKLSEKDLTQTQKEKQKYSEVKREYEEGIIEKFTFNSNEVAFKNQPDFISSMFVQMDSQ